MLKRRLYFRAEIVRRRQFVAVAENRGEAARDRTIGRRAPDDLGQVPSEGWPHPEQTTLGALIAETAPDDMATIKPWDGDGLEIPLDGSSKDAWERSLLRVKAHSEPADYQLLLSAIDYLLLYDLGAKGEMDILITRLNGLTGNQVLSRVNYRRPDTGKGQAGS